LEKPVLLNQLEMQVLNRHCKANQSSHLHKALGVNRSSRLYKTMEVNQSNNRTRIRQRPTYGDLAFSSSGVPPNSTYRIAPANNRLQKNMYGGGYSEVMDYGAIDAFPNPGYGTAPGMQDANDDLMAQKMADILQNQFGLKPKMQGQAYTPPFPKWYHKVVLPPRVKPPTDFTKFSRQDYTSTVEHIARYLMQLGEASADEAFRVRYFPLSLTGPAFTWFSSLPPQSISTGNIWNRSSMLITSVVVLRRS
jgi:hypothetical protein